MTKKPTRLFDRVTAAAALKPDSRRNWLERLPGDVRDEVLAVKAAWKAGEIDSSARRIANSIVKECLAEGIKTCSPEHMRTWLAKD